MSLKMKEKAVMAVRVAKATKESSEVRDEAIRLATISDEELLKKAEEIALSEEPSKEELRRARLAVSIVRKEKPKISKKNLKAEAIKLMEALSEEELEKRRTTKREPLLNKARLAVSIIKRENPKISKKQLKAEAIDLVKSSNLSSLKERLKDNREKNAFLQKARLAVSIIRKENTNISKKDLRSQAIDLVKSSNLGSLKARLKDWKEKGKESKFSKIKNLPEIVYLTVRKKGQEKKSTVLKLSNGKFVAGDNGLSASVDESLNEGFILNAGKMSAKLAFNKKDKIYKYADDEGELFITLEPEEEDVKEAFSLGQDVLIVKNNRIGKISEIQTIESDAGKKTMLTVSFPNGEALFGLTPEEVQIVTIEVSDNQPEEVIEEPLLETPEELSEEIIEELPPEEEEEVTSASEVEVEIKKPDGLEAEVEEELVSEEDLISEEDEKVFAEEFLDDSELEAVPVQGKGTEPLRLEKVLTSGESDEMGSIFGEIDPDISKMI